ncbi:MAG: DUF547 domain-containing protein [Actinobacteria bacterium]|nr:MAG: DUF547 domain-containing protein [Actinomycetota bacterium]
MLRIRLTVRRPRPRATGIGSVDHSALGRVLDTIAASPAPDLTRLDGDLASYIEEVSAIDPDSLGTREALALWINLYNAGALRLAAEAQAQDLSSVLRVPGAFAQNRFRVADEELSLDAVEHGKVRRFGDPRIHGALVCGSISCPTLRAEPYVGSRLDDQLDDQMRNFFKGGGAELKPDGILELNRVLLWYGADFVRPGRMPALLPTTRRSLVRAIEPWTDINPDDVRDVTFRSYDWGLRCTLG